MNVALLKTLILACGIVLTLASANGADIEFLGSYEKVESSTGEHCYGYTVDIWKQNSNPFGLFHYHNGLCGDPPCGVLDAVSYDAQKGDFHFVVKTRLSTFQFSGKLTPQSLSGSLQESPVRQESRAKETIELPRKGTRRDDEFYEQIRSLPEWHARFDSYTRCIGVIDYMKSPK